MKTQWAKALARVTSNWIVTFFGSTVVFGGKAIPEIDIILKALIFSSGIAGVALGYELKKYGDI